jgi:hypothetical protein
MDLFDSAIFDSAVFDTGAEAQVEVVLQRFITLDRERKRRRRKEEEEAERLAQEAAERIAALLPAEEIVEQLSPDIEPALEIAPPLPVYDPQAVEAVTEELKEHIAAQIAAIAAEQRRQAIELEDEDAARAFLSWLMAA